MNVPPVIDSRRAFTAVSVLPPPLPAHALQKELVSGPISSVVAALERSRRKAFWYLGGILLCAVVLVLAIGSLKALHPQGIPPGGEPVQMGDIAAISACGVAFVAGGCLVARWIGIRRRFCREYKETVFTAAIRLLGPTFRYQPAGGISLERFRQSRMFLLPVDLYSSEDHVQGVQGATAFEFAEVRASQKVSHFLKGENEDTYRPVFHGLYFIADFNKHFATSTVVLPRRGEPLGLMTSLLDKWGWKRGKIVHLEDPEFEREFIVHAEDEVEARYLLSPALMSRILEISRARGRSVSLSFLDEQLHVALSTSGDLFEPDPDSSAYSVAQIQLFLNQVRRVLSLIDVLNLNTRIWSKR